MDLPSISENQVNNSAKNAKEESEKQANIAAQKLKLIKSTCINRSNCPYYCYNCSILLSCIFMV